MSCRGLAIIGVNEGHASLKNCSKSIRYMVITSAHEKLLAMQLG